MEELLQSLPSFDTVLDLETQEDRARSVLGWGIRRALDLGQSAEEIVQPDPTNCPNCDTPFSSPRTPYCSEACKDESALIRQTRSGLWEGAILAPERQVALGQKLWRILGGGLPLRVSLIPEKVRAKYLARQEHRCAICGGEADRIDNVGSG